MNKLVGVKIKLFFPGRLKPILSYRFADNSDVDSIRRAAYALGAFGVEAKEIGLSIFFWDKTSGQYLLRRRGRVVALTRAKSAEEVVDAIRELRLEDFTFGERRV